MALDEVAVRPVVAVSQWRCARGTAPTRGGAPTLGRASLGGACSLRRRSPHPVGVPTRGRSLPSTLALVGVPTRGRSLPSALAPVGVPLPEALAPFGADSRTRGRSLARSRQRRVVHKLKSAIAQLHVAYGR